MISLLIVDDEPHLLDITKVYLEKTGNFTVDTAGSAREALEMMETNRYDAIVSDYGMPEMNRIELLKTVRGSGSDIPFIIFSERGREDMVIEALNERADFYLHKDGEPKAQFAELSHKIRRAVEQKQAKYALHKNEARYLKVVERQIEEKLAKITHRFQTIFNSLNDGLAIMDQSLTVKEVNDYRLRVLGLKKNGVIGRKCYEVFQHRDMPCEICPVQPVFEKGEMVRLEKSAVGKDGTVKYFDTQGTPILDAKGNVVQVISSIRDITEQKMTRRRLEITNKKLQLLSGTTRHDILNRVTALAGYTHLLAGILPDDTETREYIDRITKEILVIQEVITFTANYEALGMQPSRWQRVGDATERAASGSDIHVSINTGALEVFSDSMLEKVFFNLIENALRHGGHVTEISVTCREEEGGQMVISVEDDGLGVPAEIKKKIFKRGVGSNTGYGLFLTEEILEITGMTIRETGEQGKGACFEITVPPDAWRRG